MREINGENEKYVKHLQKIYKERCASKFDLNEFIRLSGDVFKNDQIDFVSLLKLINYLTSIKETGGQQNENDLSKRKKRAILVPVVEKVNPSCSNQVDENMENDKSVVRQVLNSVLSSEEERAKVNLLKYNNAILECSARIKEIENNELSLDDLNSNRSSYIVESKMKDRFNRLTLEYLKLANKYPHLVEKNNSISEDVTTNIKSIKQSYQLRQRVYHLNNRLNFTEYESLNEKIGEFCEKLKYFPEYGDIEDLIEKSNNALNLGLNSQQCKLTSIEAFKKIGNMLKTKREAYDRECLFSRFDDNYELLDDDPIKTNSEMKSALEKHRREAELKHKKIVDEYAMKQENNGNSMSSGDECEDIKTEDINEIN